MTAEEAIHRIEQRLSEMAQVLGEPVFDEWILTHRKPEGWEVLHYAGPRRATFSESFKKDVAALRGTLAPGNARPGDFAFSHQGYGSGFDAFICAGEQFFALFNNTRKNTDEITEDPKWKQAQVHFMELAETFITNPLREG